MNIKDIPDTYLGDGVYATNDGYHLILSTGSHKPSEWQSVIYLDTRVISALLNVLKVPEISTDEGE